MTWRTVKLGDVCLIEKGKTGILKAIPGEYPMVVTSEERKSHNEYQFDDEAILIPLVSSTGHGHRSLKRIHLQKGKFALGSILCAVIPKNKSELSAEYLYRFLDLNKENELVARMRGMANVSLPIKEIAQIEIPLPPINEQMEFIKKYKEIENNSSNLISEYIYQLDTVKKLRQQILQEAVQGKLVQQGNSDEPASVLLEKIKAEKAQLIADKKLKKDKDLQPMKLEEIPFDIPDNWVWCRLGEILTFGPSNGYSPQESKTGDGIKCLTLSATTSGKFKKQFFKFVDVNVAKDSYLWLKPKDILIQRGNSIDFVGIAAIYDGKLNEYIYPDLMIKMRVPDYMNTIFIHKVLISPFKRKDFQSKASGAQKSMPKINQSIIINTLIPLPPINEQNRIVAKVEELMKTCDELEKNIKNNQKYTEQLMQVSLKEALTHPPAPSLEKEGEKGQLNIQF